MLRTAHISSNIKIYKIESKINKVIINYNIDGLINLGLENIVSKDEGNALKIKDNQLYVQTTSFSIVEW